MLDPACGIGNVLYEASRSRRGRLIGYENNEATASRAAMHFNLADIPLELHVESRLRLHDYRSLSVVAVQPPWGQRLGEHDWQALPQLRFGRPRQSWPAAQYCTSSCPSLTRGRGLRDCPHAAGNSLPRSLGG